MASRNTPQKTAGGGSPAGSNRAAARAASRKVRSAPVKKPFPWSFVSGVVALVVVLVAVIAYSVVHKGSGFKTALDKADAQFPTLQITKNPTFNHTASRVAYPGEATQAPDGGDHNPVPQTCAVYTSPVVQEHAVHSLEHGAVWVTYNPSLPAAQVKTLAGEVQGNPYRMLSPYPGQKSPVALQAWGRRLDVQSADDPLVLKFLDTYGKADGTGPQSREQGTACQGVDQPGTVPFVQNSDGSFVPGTDGPAPSAAP